MAYSLPIAANQFSGRLDRASATEAVDLGSIPGRVKPDYKNWYSQLSYLTFSN